MARARVSSQRTLAKAEAAVGRIETTVAEDSDDAVGANALLGSLRLVPVACDLADLSSIDACVGSLRDGGAFDAVCYNAGVARNTGAKDVARTKQGFETTVGVNHLVSWGGRGGGATRPFFKLSKALFCPSV